MTTNPAKEAGPKYPHKKYKDRQMVKGDVQMVLMFVANCSILVLSMDIRFTVSPAINKLYQLGMALIA